MRRESFIEKSKLVIPPFKEINNCFEDKDELYTTYNSDRVALSWSEEERDINWHLVDLFQVSIYKKIIVAQIIKNIKFSATANGRTDHYNKLIKSIILNMKYIK